MIESQETLLALKISDWPYIKKGPRKNFYQSLVKKANFQKRSNKIHNTYDIANQLKKLGI